MMEESR